MDITYIILVVIIMVVGMIISGRLKSKFAKYSKVPLSNGMSGAEVARAMLDHYNIYDVNIIEGRGKLTDHYNPLNKTVSLSPDVFRGRSISSAAVAAHECGHAVQHATAYDMLTLRSSLVPVVNISSQIQQYLFYAMMFGFVAIGGGFGQIIMLALVVTFGLTALFSFITLPVEFDASKRALAWLDETGTTQGAEYEGAKDALWWAAMTYVSAALGAMVMFLYFLLRFAGND